MGKPKSNPKQSGDDMATTASKVLRNPRSSEVSKKLAASVLSQAKPGPSRSSSRGKT